MIQIRPSSTFPIVRQINDPTDATTYYVRAVIRDSISGVTLDTVNLVDQGGQRFTYNYPAPQDGSGFGRYIDITTTVYSDSGYTTRTGIYADENQTYVVKEYTGNLGGSGGGGSDVDYKKIREIVKDVIDGQEKMEMPEMPKMKDHMPEMKAIESRIIGAIDALPKPEKQKEVDLTPVLSSVDDAVNTLLIAIDQKEVTPETDLSPILNALPVQELVGALEQTQALVQAITDASEKLTAMVESQAELDQLRTAAEQFTSAVKTKKLPAVKPQTNPFTDRARRLLGNPQPV